ncbi:MAG: CoB--CoM heterodisulfide reductase iron-sulfur subunit B family protein [Bacteroidaceae bacterium]
MNIGFYPGCSLKGSSKEYNESVLALGKALDIEFEEINDWNCCGASSAHALSKELALSLPARVLALAEQQGLKEVVVPCAACYNRLSTTQYELAHNEKLKEKITAIIGLPYKGDVKILNVLQLLQRYTDVIKTKALKPFFHQVACYYGCLLVRPHKVLQFDQVEDPQVMDLLMLKIGAVPIDWAFKTECCGGGFSVSQTSIVSKLSGNLLKDATDRGAEAIIVACPMCHSNLDMRRPEINEYLNAEIKVPVLYITQAIGLALGLSHEALGLKRHLVPVSLT